MACAPDRPPQQIVALPAEKQINDGMGEAMEGVTRRNDWPQGVAELEAARERGCWQDGRPVGRGFPQPCLQPGYASLIAAGVKTAEGRPGGGWLKTLPQPNDYINFQARVRPRAWHAARSLVLAHDSRPTASASARGRSMAVDDSWFACSVSAPSGASTT